MFLAHTLVLDIMKPQIHEVPVLIIERPVLILERTVLNIERPVLLRSIISLFNHFLSGDKIEEDTANCCINNSHRLFF